MSQQLPKVLAGLVSASLLAIAAGTGAAAAASPSPAADPSGHQSEMQAAAARLAAPATAGPAPVQRAAPAATASPAARPMKEVFGFAQAGGLSSGSSTGWTTWDFSAITTLAYFGLQIGTDGHVIQSGTGWAGWAGANAADTHAMITAARAAGVRVVLTIVAQYSSSQECSALLNYGNTINDTINEVQNRYPGQIDGVNVDYESGNQTCGGVRSSDLLRSMVQGLRWHMPGIHLTVDTYASSATDTTGFYDVAGMRDVVNGFFVMAYDLDNSNWGSAPLNCSRYCFSPNSPTSGPYRYNDTQVISDYSAVAGAGKTILGVPYYGYTACVPAAADNALPYPSSGTGPLAHWTVPRYDDSVSIQSDPAYAPYNQHRDRNDGSDRWDDFHSNTYGCTRETYWNDAYALGVKYDLVNRTGVLGVGIFSLDYGGGHAELWDALRWHFQNLPGAPTNVVAAAGNGFADVSWAAPSAPAPIQSYVVTASPGGASVTVGGGALSAPVGPLSNGTAYTFTVRATDAYGTGPGSAPSNAVTPAPAPGAWPGRQHVLSPARVLDTRVTRTPFAAGETRTLPILGQGGVPASGVTAVVLNVTTTNATAPSYVAVTPSGSSPGAVSSVNFVPGEAVANLAQVALGADGRLQVFNSAGSADVIIDVFGWFGTSGDTGADGHLTPLAPARVLDTRSQSQGYGALSAGQTVHVQVAGRGGVPLTGAGSVVVNLTAVNPTAPSYLSAWASDGAQPATSNLNFLAGQTIANRAVVALGSDGAINVFNSAGTTQVLVDVVGYYTSAAGSGGTLYTGDTPLRVLDTRDGLGGTQAPVAAGTWVPVTIAGQPAVPAGVKAALVNVTVTDTTTYSYVAVNSVPAATGTSDVNFGAGMTIANIVLVPVGSDGKIYLFNSAGTADVIVDLYGWYS